MVKPILCLDFDGTIHAYKSGWQGADIISDAPVESAFLFIEHALKDFEVHIFSARSGLPGGIDAMKSWFIKHGWETTENGEPKGIYFPLTKPPAHVSIDDRAINFTGTWPSIQSLKDFRPWNDLDT
jgi:hypothetical protein